MPRRPSRKASKRTRAHDAPLRADPSIRVSAKSQRTYLRIIDAAIESFIVDGYARTNMSRIAERAGLTRTRVQYYFGSTEQLLSEATQTLLTRVWGRYVDQLYTRATLPMEAFDRLMALRNDREYVAWIELVAASRTDATLRRIVEHAQRDLEHHSATAQRRLLAPTTTADEERLAALADLVWLVLQGLTLSVMPDGRSDRIERVLAAFKDMLTQYWRQPPNRSRALAS
jgi:AcrR family transcriptional regulator